MSDDTHLDRRGFLGTAAMTLAAERLGVIGHATASSGKSRSTTAHRTARPTHTSFESLKQIDAGLLNVGYAEAGPANGPSIAID